jgi:hypothetical protein
VFAAEDGTVSLFGFGIDSFVEVISGIGIRHMVRRIERRGDENRGSFERPPCGMRLNSLPPYAFFLMVLG